jgi:hypothetical protein
MARRPAAPVITFEGGNERGEVGEREEYSFHSISLSYISVLLFEASLNMKKFHRNDTPLVYRPSRAPF